MNKPIRTILDLKDTVSQLIRISRNQDYVFDSTSVFIREELRTSHDDGKHKELDPDNDTFDNSSKSSAVRSTQL